APVPPRPRAWPASSKRRAARSSSRPDMPTRKQRSARREADAWWLPLFLRLYPRQYRERHRYELAEAMHACIERERRHGAHPLATAVRLTADGLHSSILVRRDSAPRASRLAPRSPGDSLMQSLRYDLRHAFRLLRRAPLFSALIIATL